MHAQVLVGVELPLPMEHADLAAGVSDDPALTVGKLGGFGDKNFRHAVRLRPDGRLKTKYGIEPSSTATKQPSPKSNAGLRPCALHPDRPSHRVCRAKTRVP